jgi:O-methyltransferase involved in polyketide biosynthesis
LTRTERLFNVLNMRSPDGVQQSQNRSGKIRVDLTGAPETMLATLYARALDAEARNPILGDEMAREMVSRIDYDWRKTTVKPRNASAVTLRSAHFDNCAAQFLAAHDRARVLHVGCGLDTRVFRLDPGPGVEWYDIDYPNVIALAKQLYPRRDHHHLVPSSATDPEWLQTIPADRPTLLLAEGLTPYFTEDDGVALLRRVVERFPSGEVQFDAYSRFGIKTSNSFNKVIRRSGATLQWAINRPEDIIGAVPGIRLLAAVSAFQTDTVARLPAVYRLVFTVMALIPALRRMAQYLRYEF